MYNTTEAVKAALGQSVVHMRLLSEYVSLLAPDSKPIQSSDGKPIWVFAKGPFPDGRIEGEQLTRLSYSAGCCDGDIGIGSVSAASLSGSIHGVLNLLGVAFTAQVGVDVDGVTQWLNLGNFTVTECNRTDDSTTFTAYDAAYTAFSAIYTPTVQSGATASTVLADVANQAGVEVEPTTLNLCTMTVTGDLTGHTCREMVGYIAALCGKNALITRDGFLRFVFVTQTEQTVTADDYYAGAMSNGGISKLWGLSCTVPGQEEEQTLTVGDTKKAVTVSCPYMTQAQLVRVWFDIGGYEYPVGNVSFYRGLLTEPGDLVSLTNLAGNTITLPAMQVNLEIDGGCRCTISSFGKSEAVRTSGTAGPMEKRLQFVQRTASRAMSSANGKNKVFHQASAPAASEGLTAGDLWFNTSLGNQIATWDGAQWTAFRLQDEAVSNLDAGAITSGKLLARFIDVDDLFAQNITATGKITGAILETGDPATSYYFKVNDVGLVEAYTVDAKSIRFKYSDGDFSVGLTDQENVDIVNVIRSGPGPVYGRLARFHCEVSSNQKPVNEYCEFTGDINATGTVSAVDINATGTVSAVDINATGTVSAGDIQKNGLSLLISTNYQQSVTIPASDSLSGSFQADDAYYSPLSIAGYFYNGPGLLFISKLEISGNTCYYTLKNHGATTIRGTLNIRILRMAK